MTLGVELSGRHLAALAGRKDRPVLSQELEVLDDGITQLPLLVVVVDLSFPGFGSFQRSFARIVPATAQFTNPLAFYASIAKEGSQAPLGATSDLCDCRSYLF